MKTAFRLFIAASLCAFLFVLASCSQKTETEMTGTFAGLARVGGEEAVAAPCEADFISAEQASVSFENVSYLEISDEETVCTEWGIAGSVCGYFVEHAALQLYPVNESEDLEKVVGAEFLFESESGGDIVVVVSEIGPSEEVLNRSVHTVFLLDSEGRTVAVMKTDGFGGIPGEFLEGLLIE